MFDQPSQAETGHRQPPPHPGLGLVRATESAALAAGRWMGLGDRLAADQAAQDAMAEALNLMPMQGRIVSGEELRLGGHSRLDSGAPVGNGKGPELDVEVNAIDGASLVAEGRPGSMSVAAFAGPGAMWKPSPAVYMQKLVVDRRAAAALGPEALDAPPGWVLALVARQMGKEIRDLVVFILERPYHENLIDEVRRAGARVYLRPAGDIAGAIQTADPAGGLDVMMGIGGASEGLLAACAVKALGGGMLGRVHARDADERKAFVEAGVKVDRVLDCGDMVAGDDVFFTATGVTDTPLLRGVRYHGDVVETQSLVLRMDTGTRRLITTEHRLR
ncbi:MAG TPA: fructose-bisphosphatase class II family protein [Candidatus Krumholzibacteria bacterium]|nr:fructose-bisphosphatase class II family protein [Candidatus Krumholzibacteria bacterium]